MGRNGKASKQVAVVLRPQISILILIVLVLGGCASIPPGSSFPKTPSVAFDHPEQTSLGRKFADAAREHGDNSGFRIVTKGIDGFLIRAQMIDSAERAIDLQYFFFSNDETGRLLAQALLRAADRGVRVRILVDDAETIDGNKKIAALQAHPNIEVRIFNPLVYRGSVDLFRFTEFVFNKSRLDYRMHNKLFVVDNAVALIGGRNVGDGYFQVDVDVQFGDDDVFCVGPVVKQLSATFDDYWNSTLAIPSAALAPTSSTNLSACRQELAEPHQTRRVDNIDLSGRIATGMPLAAIVSGDLPLAWANAQVLCDSPYKSSVEKGEIVGKLMHQDVALRMAEVQSELLMVTPFVIPGDEGMRLLRDLMERNVRIRILTNSFESAYMQVAQAGYMHYRLPLLEFGVELYEVRARLGSSKGSGESKKMTRFGNYSLHAKLFVFDRKSVFIGSMNFDQRSMHLNTEVGLIIDSPELAQQVVKRFEAMADLKNSYTLMLQGSSSLGKPHLLWRTQEDGKIVEYTTEPARSAWQRFKVNSLSLLPLDKEL